MWYNGLEKEQDLEVVVRLTSPIAVVFLVVAVCLTAGVAGAQARCDIALVSDDSTLDNGTFLTALSGMGISYTVFNYNETSEGGPIAYMDDPTFLAARTVIVWYQSGYGGSGRAITQAEHDAVAAWLAAGGRLIVTGYDVIGSPDDPLMADLIRSSTYGDYTDGYYSNVVADHPISNGPYGNFVGQNDIEAYYSDNDDAVADTARGALMISEVNYDLADNVAKIMATDDAGTGMAVVFWNGNYEIYDWTESASYPELYNMMRNMMVYICSGAQQSAPGIPTVNRWGAVLLVLLIAVAGAVLAFRRL